MSLFTLVSLYRWSTATQPNVLLDAHKLAYGKLSEELADQLLHHFLGLVPGLGETVPTFNARMMKLCFKLDGAPVATREPTESEKDQVPFGCLETTLPVDWAYQGYYDTTVGSSHNRAKDVRPEANTRPSLTALVFHLQQRCPVSSMEQVQVIPLISENSSRR